MPLTFEISARDGEARTGLVRTAHGSYETPAFMPVGTAATVKGIMPRALPELGAQIVLCNTYHLLLRPGVDVIAAAGGLHRFMGVDLPILTDSGGFQVFSLSNLRKLTEAGVEFRSHVDGAKVMLTPESSIETQRGLGVDIMMAFDECTPWPATEEQAAESMHLSARWARRSREAAEGYDGSVFGIVQGGMFDELREQSIELTTACDFHGYALGGLSVGEPKPEMFAMVERFIPRLPAERPRYLMGVGYPLDILHAVANGCDMFDCVLPTRDGRNGQLFTSAGELKIKQARYVRDYDAPDPDCDCYVCSNFSRAYLSHLYRAGEMLSGILCSHHNLHFYQRLMRGAREAIAAGTFDEYHNGWKSRLAR